MSSDVIGKFIFCPAELLSHCFRPTFHALPYLNILPYSAIPSFVKGEQPTQQQLQAKQKTDFRETFLFTANPLFGQEN
jgi:hypothetical protein